MKEKAKNLLLIPLAWLILCLFYAGLRTPEKSIHAVESTFHFVLSTIPKSVLDTIINLF